MPRFFRLIGFLGGFFLLWSALVSAQDLAVRVEAVRLMERANAVSRPTHRTPNHKE
jgi:hypothetical protein